MNQYTGPVVSHMVGGYSFLGGGTYAAQGAPIVAIASTAFESGAGSGAFLGGGIATFIAAPIIDFGGIGCGFFFGEYVFVGGGLFTWLFSPVIVFTAIDYFQGYGGFMFVGGGGALLGYSPSYQRYFITDSGRDWWIAGVCEPETGDVDAWAPGKPFFVSKGYQGARANCTSGEEFRQLPVALPPSPTKRQQRHGLLVPPKGGLVAFNTTREMVDLGNGAQMAQFRAYGVPEVMLATLAATQRALDPYRTQPLDGKLQDSPDSFGPAFYLNSETEGYCGICGEESVGGPGLKGCDHAASCADFTPPEEYEGLFDYTQLDFQDRYILVGDLETTSLGHVTSEYLNHSRRLEEGWEESKANTLQTSVLEEALRQAVFALVPDVDVRPEALQAGVWRADPDPLFADMFEPPPPSFFATQDGYETTHRHKVSVVTTSKANAESLLEALRAAEASVAHRRRLVEEDGLSHAEAQASGSDAFAAALRAFVQEEAGIELSHVGLSFDRVLHVPAYSSELLAQKEAGTALHLGSYTVVLSDPRISAVPLTHAEYKKPYVVHIEQFPAHSPVKIELVGIPNDADDAAGAPVPEALAFRSPDLPVSVHKPLLGAASLKTDADGVLDFPYRFLRLVDAPPGDYYLQATHLETGAFGQSPVFTLSTTARRRKLYGPLQRI